MKTPAQRKAQSNWYWKHKHDPEFKVRQKANKMAYYLKNKAKINDQALNRYYKKRYPQGKPELFYSENIAKLFNITKVEANVLAKLLGVPKNFGRYFWSKRYINMIHWIIRFKEVNK